MRGVEARRQLLEDFQHVGRDVGRACGQHRERNEPDQRTGQRRQARAADNQRDVERTFERSHRSMVPSTTWYATKLPHEQWSSRCRRCGLRSSILRRALNDPRVQAFLKRKPIINE